MAKIFVDVKTPGNGKTYEFQLESEMTVAQTKDKLIGEITELENGNITLVREKVLLCSLNTNQRLREGDTLAAAGIKSGCNLLLA